MQNDKRLLLLVTATSMLWVITSVGIESDLPTNRAILASPRTLEQFPELLRGHSISPAEAATRAVREKQQLDRVRDNAAVAASPRTLEQFPELVRVPPSAEELIASAARREQRLRRLAENRAVTASPRILEEFPELDQSRPTFEIAPLK